LDFKEAALVAGSAHVRVQGPREPVKGCVDFGHWSLKRGGEAKHGACLLRIHVSFFFFLKNYKKPFVKKKEKMNYSKAVRLMADENMPTSYLLEQLKCFSVEESFANDNARKRTGSNQLFRTRGAAEEWIKKQISIFPVYHKTNGLEYRVVERHFVEDEPRIAELQQRLQKEEEQKKQTTKNLAANAVAKLTAEEVAALRQEWKV
jgi:hypothetical protein